MGQVGETQPFVTQLADGNIGMEAQDACALAAVVLWPAGESRAPRARPLCPWVHLVLCPYRFQFVSDLELSCSFPSGHQEPRYILMRRKSKPFSLELHKRNPSMENHHLPTCTGPRGLCLGSGGTAACPLLAASMGGQNWASGPPGPHPSVAP